MEGGEQGLIFGGHSLSVTGQARSKQLDEHHILSPPSLWRDLGYRHATP